MSKPERKTTEPKYCAKHSCYFEESHEYNDGTKDFPWVCPKCEEDAKVLKKQQYKIKLCVESFTLPKRLKNYTFKTFKETSDNKSKRDVCLSFVDKFPNVGSIVMLGGVGTGKTHLAIAVCQSLVLKGVSCKLTTVNNIVRDIRSVWGKKTQYYSVDPDGFDQREKTESTIIKDYNNYDLLVIDEIGSQYGSDSEKIIVNEIINNRYEEMNPTIVMGNLSVSEINNILGERVVDRLTHDGHLLFFEWESLRRTECQNHKHGNTKVKS